MSAFDTRKLLCRKNSSACRKSILSRMSEEPFFSWSIASTSRATVFWVWLSGVIIADILTIGFGKETRRVAAAAEILQINFLDHIIAGQDYFSFQEAGVLGCPF